MTVCLVFVTRQTVMGSLRLSHPGSRGTIAKVRLSDFWRLMDDEFGAGYSRTLATTLVLAEVGGLTAAEALNTGVPPKMVWRAMCKMQDVPAERWLGRDIAVKDD